LKDKVILTSSLKTLMPIIKIVGNKCNLKCDYCFYHDTNQSANNLMEFDLLEKFIKQYLRLFPTEKVFFIWHGGEPTLAGINYFQSIIELQNKYKDTKQTIRNAIQTNATLIDNKWSAFFRQHNFRVGVSLDGNQESHAIHRNKSFTKTINGIRCLRKFNLEPGIIQTLTKSQVCKTESNFDYFVHKLKIRKWGTNIYHSASQINHQMRDESIENKDLTEYISALLNLWLKTDQKNLQIREIDNFVSGVLGTRANSCSFNGSCTGYFCLDYDGTIFPCDRLANKKELIFGNLSNQPLIDILNGPARQNFVIKTKKINDDCKNCQWFHACHNGCTGQRAPNIDGKYIYCESRKILFKLFDDIVRKANQIGRR